MTILKKRLPVLALGLAVTALASPSRPPERSYDSLGATDPTGAVGKPDSGPALGSRAGTHHQRANLTASVPGPNRNRAMTCGSG